MRRFSCACDSPVFFDSSECTGCGCILGFDPGSLSMLPLSDDTAGSFRSDDGRQFSLCRNRLEHGICNWLIPAGSGEEYCLACRLNEIVPALESPRQRVLWSRLEAAKQRLIYSLLSLGVPPQIPGGKRISFRFLADKRTNPNVSESFVITGHLGGTITINVAEADDSMRHAVREDMQERYRTLLGHFRHESAHFYFDYFVATRPDARDEFRLLFGDERADYKAALERHYGAETPAVSDWQGRFISAYASSHPLEDWAETWAHYLHIRDTLETAVAWGVAAEPDTSPDSSQWVVAWMNLSVVLNELSRSLGAGDAYPFVLSDPVIDKLTFVHRRVLSTPPAEESPASR